MKLSRTSGISVQWLGALLLGTLAAACGSDRPGAAPAALGDPTWEPRSSAAPGPCETGAVQECTVTLSQHDGVLNCYHGQQVCVDGSWGSCGSGEMTSLPAPGEALRGTDGLHFLAVTGAETCRDNPCDPSCLQIAAEDGSDTSALNGNLGSFKWQTGALQSFPGGLVSKAMKEPCSSGSDCQLDSRCVNPVTESSCAHSKCATGAALDATCDSCVTEICAADPACCVQPSSTPPSCAHSPCTQGAALDSACDPCVTAICLSRPSCCSGSWDATCAASVVSVCGNSCRCATGQVSYDGACYVKEETDRSWSAARSACQALGGGWDLMSVNDSAENNFALTSLIDDSETWIGLTDGNGIGTDGKWKWANGNPSSTYDESLNRPYGDVITVSSGASWKYLANDTDPGATWRNASFDDSSWSTGNAQLGFGDNDEATSFTRNGPSYYFRRTFTLTRLPSAASLRTTYDDGFVAYVNGTEVRRANVTTASHANYADSTNRENDVDTATFAVSPFVIGTNVLAVLVKNGSSSNTDLSFDARLTLTYGDDRAFAFGSDSWKYYSAASAPPATWLNANFADASWSNGTGQLGFGEGDESTAFTQTGVSYYFRRHFTLTQPLSSARLSVLYDDGFVAYVNGTEVSRENVGDTAHSERATDSADNEVDTTAVSTSPFVVGDNVLAVQVKNRTAGSNDLSFDAQLDYQVAGGNSMYQSFGSGEPGTEACVRFDANRVGTWGDKACAQATDSACEGPPSEMIGGGGVPLWGPWTAIGYGSSWKYRANATDPGGTWNTAGFNDAGWSSGVGQLGFGDGDQATTLPNVAASYYFRKTLNVPTAISDATLSVLYDDGLVVYVNGTEVLNRNVGSTAHTAYATRTSSDNETLSVPISKTPFVVGNNTIAVQVKNGSASSSDVSFDLKLDVTLCGSGGCPPEPTWSQACVDKVASVCDAQCNLSTSNSGQCEPWFPGETDPSCAGVDLTAGVTCDGNIPVCNHGLATAPAGVSIVHFPANSQQYPNTSPNLSHPGMVTCTTGETIPPGHCINVTNCTGLNGNREIMINPPGAGQVAECSTRDNWGLYSNGQCGEPTCDGGSSIATLTKKPVDIIIAIDNSGSMQGEILQVQQRINRDFASIIEASGIDYRVIMMSRYGNVNTAVGGSDYPICVSSPLGGHDCSNPIGQGLRNNPPKFYHFSTDVGSLDALCRIVQGYNTGDELASDTRTWTQVARNGYKELLRDEAYKVFLVITDDHVSCSYGGYTFNDLNTVDGGNQAASTFDSALRGLSSTHFGTAGARNYTFHSIVGLAENSPATTPWPASAAITTSKCSPGSERAGTGYQALSKLTGGLRYPICRNDDFNAIFQAVAREVVEGASVSCSIELGHGAEADPDKTSVRFTPGSGTTTTLTRVADAAACVDNGYYYASATTITLCPTTCNSVQGDSRGTINVAVGCKGAGGYEPKVLTETYTSECNEDTRIQWGFMTYDTSTPGDSSVRFRIRTASTEAGLANATWIDAATAQASPNTQRCSMAGPTPCPIDLFTLLGGSSSPAVHHDFAQVEVTLNPTSDATQPATVQGWQLNYSCPYAQ